MRAGALSPIRDGAPLTRWQRPCSPSSTDPRRPREPHSVGPQLEEEDRLDHPRRQRHQRRSPPPSCAAMACLWGYVTARRRSSPILDHDACDSTPSRARPSPQARPHLPPKLPFSPAGAAVIGRLHRPHRACPRESPPPRRLGRGRIFSIEMGATATPIAAAQERDRLRHRLFGARAMLPRRPTPPPPVGVADLHAHCAVRPKCQTWRRRRSGGRCA